MIHFERFVVLEEAYTLVIHNEVESGHSASETAQCYHYLTRDLAYEEHNLLPDIGVLENVLTSR